MQKKRHLTIFQEHIVQYVGETVIKENKSFVMTYHELGDLSAQDKTRRFTSFEIIQIGCQTLQALVFLHSRGMIHRDLKPANILVQRRDPLHIRVADFGLASDASTFKTYCGTQDYMAPEIGRGSYTSAVDMWALGVIIFAMSDGLPRLNPNVCQKLWCKAILAKVMSWGKTGGSLASIVSTAMIQESPEDRLSARECLARFDALLPPARSPEATGMTAPSSTGNTTPHRVAGFFLRAPTELATHNAIKDERQITITHVKKTATDSPSSSSFFSRPAETGVESGNRGLSSAAQTIKRNAGTKLYDMDSKAGFWPTVKKRKASAEAAEPGPEILTRTVPDLGSEGNLRSRAKKPKTDHDGGEAGEEP